ncbi:polysaccharide pyruvyl transferase family protein [uncultured Roseovarius sp.]|uniref:polysaccharide pyruvyl transferase family protein n=1 Tax=uncultured Roseovarius sp. TaxID=293344 RepID=UPI0025E5B355|nr:polysaccharide pyruvyl transferase family protein [uncultured Roseovarius sp.]
MQQVYHVSPYGNFGDDLNAWFWDEVLPGWRDWEDSVTLVGIGTILNAGLLPTGKLLVIGSGVGYGRIPDVSNSNDWDIRAVRGPRTTRVLGLGKAKSFSDPAIVLPCLEMFHDIEKTDEILFVPHVGSDQSFDWDTICGRLGLSYQSPSAPPEVVIKRLASAHAVIAESMHAAIISDAFGTPWTAVQINKSFNRFKWFDWSESLKMKELKIYKFFPLLRGVQAVLDRIGERTSKPVPSNVTKGKTVPCCPSMARKGKILHYLAYFHLKQVNKRARFGVSDRPSLKKAQERYFNLFHEIHRYYSDRSG